MSATNNSPPMREIQFLKLVMYQLDGMLGPALACCGVTRKSSQRKADAVPSRP